MKTIYIALIRSLIYILIAVTLFGCEREIEIPFPESDPKLVVNSLATSGELLRVFVSRTLGMEEEEIAADLYLSDATVELWEEGIFQENLTFVDSQADREFGYYSSQPIQAGKSYRLLVRHPDYPETSLEMTMPEALELSDFRYLPDAGIGADGNPLVQLIASLEDQAAFQNYYALRATLLAFPKDSTASIQAAGGYWQPFSTEGGNILSYSYYTLSDQAFDGKKVDLIFEAEFENGFEFDREEYPTQYIVYDLISLNNAAYRQGNEYSLHRSAQRFVDFDLSVLTRTPLPMYSNAEGGFGIFGGITMVSGRLDL